MNESEWELNARPGIYQIVHIRTGLRYLGQAVNIRERWRRHLWALRTGAHHSRYFQRLWNHEGPDAFRWEVVEFIERIDDIAALRCKLLEREAHYFHMRQSAGGSQELNGRPAAESMLGFRHSQQTRTRLSAQRLGRPLTLAQREARQGRMWSSGRRAAAKSRAANPTQRQLQYWERLRGSTWTAGRRQSYELQESRQLRPHTMNELKALAESNAKRHAEAQAKEQARQARMDGERLTNGGSTNAQQAYYDRKRARRNADALRVLNSISALQVQGPFPVNMYQLMCRLASDLDMGAVTVYKHIKRLQTEGKLDADCRIAQSTDRITSPL